MSGISSIQGSASYRDYGNFASGKKINSAADGAAELSIIQKENAQIKGQKAGENNIGSAKDMLNVAEGAMSGITDQLQRMRELALQASNTGIMSDSDRANIQKEIDQLKQGISDIASQTTYNTKNLLDGSSSGFQIATDANGGSMVVNTGDATLQQLGIANFDVTGNFDIKDIDNALKMVTESRSSMGAQSNALEYAYNNSANARLNHTAAKSRLEDLDIPQAISELKKKQTLQEYSMFMQKRLMTDKANRMSGLLA